MAPTSDLRVLREAGLVRVRVDGQRRLYGLRPQPLTELDEWLEPCRRFWGARLDALEQLTDPAELHKWWGDADLDLTDGGRFTLRWRNTDDHGNAATLEGTISKLDPPRLLEIAATWGSTAAGWHLHLDALAAVLAGDQVDLAHPEPLFEPIHQAYTQKYGSGSE